MLVELLWQVRRIQTLHAGQDMGPYIRSYGHRSHLLPSLILNTEVVSEVWLLLHADSDYDPLVKA